MSLEKIVGRISLVGLRISELAVLLLLFITAYSVVGRYLFNSPSIHAVEVSKYLMVVLVWAGAAWAYRINRHVGFETVKYIKNETLKRICVFISRTAVFLFSVIIFYSGILATLTAFDKNYRTASLLDFPLWVILACIPLGVMLLGLESLVKSDVVNERQTTESSGSEE